MQMTSREEIEHLLNQTGRTLEGLPEHHNDAEIHNRIKELIGAWGLYAGMPELGEHILHQSDVIEVLVGALRDALAKEPKWVNAEKRMPEDDLNFIENISYRPIKVLAAVRDKDAVVIRTQTRYKECLQYGEKRQEYWRWDYSPGTVTHWMPLPEPPKENNQ